MNKNTKGLLKYILLLILLWLTPIAMFYCGLIAYGLSDHYNDYFAMVFLLLALVLFILYFALPITFTYKAIKHHWSKYLDKFFHNKWIPTIILVLLLCLYFVLTPFQQEIMLFYILPYYCVIYLTILITNLINWCKNK